MVARSIVVKWKTMKPGILGFASFALCLTFLVVSCEKPETNVGTNNPGDEQVITVSSKVISTDPKISNSGDLPHYSQSLGVYYTKYYNVGNTRESMSALLIHRIGNTFVSYGNSISLGGKVINRSMDSSSSQGSTYFFYGVDSDIPEGLKLATPPQFVVSNSDQINNISKTLTTKVPIAATNIALGTHIDVSNDFTVQFNRVLEKGGVSINASGYIRPFELTSPADHLTIPKEELQAIIGENATRGVVVWIWDNSVVDTITSTDKNTNAEYSLPVVEFTAVYVDDVHLDK
ncbi:MAG TPA: hypothetical protein PLC94_10945 [bacterium]|nr:hypothetical protein [bacterium]